MIINFIHLDLSTSTVSFCLSDLIKYQGFKYYLHIDYSPIFIQFDLSSEVQTHTQLPACYLHLGV